MRVRKIAAVTAQILATPDGPSIILEILDEDERDFMAFRIGEDDVLEAIIYDSSEALSLPVAELERVIRIARKEVFKVDFEPPENGEDPTQSGDVHN